MAMPLYVVGSSNTDLVVKAERLPIPGETVLGGTFLMNPGGKGANQAVTAARLGSTVTLIARVGNDLFGKQALQQFEREKINTKFVTTDTECPSGVALIGVDANGENSILVAPGANSQLDIRVVEEALESINDPAIVLLQLEIPIHIVEFVIERSYEKKLQVILNPAPVQKLHEKIFQHLYLITPNEFEAYNISGYNKFLTKEGYPAIAPPWGTLNAIDLKSGELVWKKTLGEDARMKALGAEETGTENYGGPVVTEGGVLFIAATKESKFRAFNKRTGELLWETTLPASGFATPATYEVNGRQYLVIACSGGKLGTKSGDSYVAFALPDNKL